MPAQHVADSWQSAEFFANKIVMEFRGKDEAQVGGCVCLGGVMWRRWGAGCVCVGGRGTRRQGGAGEACFEGDAGRKV